MMPFVSAVLAAAIPVLLTAYLVREIPVLQAHSLVIPPANAPVIAPRRSETDGAVNAVPGHRSAAENSTQLLPSRSALEQIKITEARARDIIRQLDPPLGRAYGEIVQDVVRDLRNGDVVSEHDNIKRMNKLLMDCAPDIFQREGPQTGHAIPPARPSATWTPPKAAIGGAIAGLGDRMPVGIRPKSQERSSKPPCNYEGVHDSRTDTETSNRTVPPKLWENPTPFDLMKLPVDIEP
jgi:hypothetical protein